MHSRTEMHGTNQNLRVQFERPQCKNNNSLCSNIVHQPVFHDVNVSDEWLANLLISDGRPNVMGLQITIRSNWNLALFDSLCTSDFDRQIASFLRYGWPLNRDKSPVTQTWVNHPTANRYPQQVTQYIMKELRLGSLFGPFVTSPFPSEITGISPLSTKAKKQSNTWRIIVDLSWPKQGHSVNSGIPKDVFLETPVKITYPTVDLLCKRAVEVGPREVGWRKDISRAFLQLPLDPLYYSYLGVTWMGGIYFCKSAVMGCRSSPLACQYTTSVIRHFMKQLQHVVYNYVDDFMSIDTWEKAWSSFHTMARLLRDLGVNEAVEKSISPMHIIEFLGIIFDLLRMIIMLPSDKLEEIKRSIKEWKRKKTCTLNDLQRMAGKLQFAAICVRPGRVFIT